MTYLIILSYVLVCYVMMCFDLFGLCYAMACYVMTYYVHSEEILGSVGAEEALAKQKHKLGPCAAYTSIDMRMGVGGVWESERSALGKHRPRLG